MILVVDDNQPTRESLAKILRSKGYDTRTAPSGHAALYLIQELRPHLILLDVQMKDMSGLDVLKKIQSDPDLGQLRVIVFTGDRCAKELALAGGAVACIIKSKSTIDALWQEIQKLQAAGEQGAANE